MQAERGKRRSSKLLSRLSIAALVSILVLGAVCSVAAEGLTGTLIARSGNRHELTKIKIRGRSEIEYYVAEQRRLVPLKEVKSNRLDGERGDEEQPIRIELRSGRVETGIAFTGGQGSSPHQDTIGGALARNELSGSTNLGPFITPLNEVRELIFRYPEDSVTSDRRLTATVVAQKGRMSRVRNLTYRGKSDFDFSQGRKKRSLDMALMSKMEFDDGGSGREVRTVAITLRSGKQIQGTVEASIFRLSGETDRQFENRIASAFTGQTADGLFAIGMHRVKLIVFISEEEETAAVADTTAGRAQ